MSGQWQRCGFIVKENCAAEVPAVSVGLSVRTCWVEVVMGQPAVLQPYGALSRDSACADVRTCQHYCGKLACNACRG